MTTPSIRAIIVDDEPLAIDGLRRLLERAALAQVIGTATNGKSALSLVREQAPDLVFLDIGMPGLSGLALAAKFAELPRPPLVIFVTAYDHFATEAFDLAVTDYVLKPVETERIERAVKRAAASLDAASGAKDEAESLWAPSRGAMVRIPINTISRVEAERDYVRIHATGRSYLLRRSIASICACLDPELFLRIHRSTIVRRDRIQALRHLGAGVWAVLDEEGRSVRIGRSYLPLVRARLGANIQGV